MPNAITIATACSMSTPDGGTASFTIGQVVLPSSPFYWGLLWGGYTTDTGIVAPQTAKVALTDLERERQRTRQETDMRMRLPLSTEATSVTRTATYDATLTKSYTFDVSAQTNGTFRIATPAELLAFPVDTGVPAAQKVVYKNTGGFFWNLGANTPAIAVGGTAHIMPTEYKFRTNAPKIQVTLYRLSGATVDGDQVFINGQPVSMRPAVGSAAADYTTLVFPDSQMRDISVCTTAALGPLYINPIYEVVRPEPRGGCIWYVTGDSYSEPLVWTDAGGGNGILMEGLGWGHHLYHGGSDTYVDAVSGTGFIRNVVGGWQTPSNTYENRLPQLVAAAAAAWANNQQEFVWFIPNGAINDVSNMGVTFNGVTVSNQTINDAFRRMAVALRAAHPKAKIIWGQGFCPPAAALSGLAAAHTALRSFIQTANQDIGVYYIDTTGWISGTGYLPSNANTTGNSSVYVGSDAAHLTGIGYLYIKKRYLHKLRRILVDDGTLLNQVI